MRIFLIPILFLLSAANCVAAGDPTALWQKGTALYEQKKYDSAAYYFEQIAASKPQNADLYYNLGNTYYKLNNIPQAVLNYQRALRIDPNYKNAKENLALTEGRISNHIHDAGNIFFITWWKDLTQQRKATLWAVLAFVSFTLIIAFLLARRYSKAGAKLPVQLPGIFTFFCFCLMILAYSSARNSVAHDAAVVMQNDAPLMNSELKGKPLALIPEGTTVEIKEEQGQWTEVALPDGRTGWLQQSELEKI